MMKKFVNSILGNYFVATLLLVVALSVNSYALLEGKYISTLPLVGDSVSVKQLEGSSAGWKDIDNLFTSDDKYVTLSNNLLFSGSYTDFIVISGFGASIPENSIITGIIVRIERGDINNAVDHKVLLSLGDEFVSDNLARSQRWFDEVTIPYGDKDNLWGSNLSAKEINSPNFGVALSIRNPDGKIPFPKLDQITIDVYYSEPAAPGLIDLKVKLVNDYTQITWISDESGEFELQRSTDNNKYVTLKKGLQPIFGSTYSYADPRPFTGSNYYRVVKRTTTSRDAVFFEPQKVYVRSGGMLSIKNTSFDSEVSTLDVLVRAKTEEMAYISVYDSSGRQIHNSAHKLFVGENSIDLAILRNVPKGAATLTIRSISSRISKQIII